MTMRTRTGLLYPHSLCLSVMGLFLLTFKQRVRGLCMCKPSACISAIVLVLYGFARSIHRPNGLAQSWGTTSATTSFNVTEWNRASFAAQGHGMGRSSSDSPRTCLTRAQRRDLHEILPGIFMELPSPRRR